jgi:hypothetical protein
MIDDSSRDVQHQCEFSINKKSIMRFSYKSTFEGDRPTIEQTLNMIREQKFEMEHPKR